MPKPKILIADDDAVIRDIFKKALENEYEILLATNGSEAMEKIEQEMPDLVLLDIRMPPPDGMEILRNLKNRYDIPAIMITAVKDVKTAVEAMKLGAFDYLVKPFELDEVKLCIKRALENRDMRRELEQLRREVKEKYGFKNIIGSSPAMKQVFELMSKVLDNDITVLIEGESGTGKELVARAIHYNGSRRKGPFIAIDCGAIPENLLESELFGYEKGAFTGAVASKPGKIELANGGTLFLDEISNLKPDLQSKLLRILEEKKIYRLGGVKPIEVDVRIIAATNVDLEEMVKAGKFREDLFYRINVFKIKLPPLRERKEDIPLLVQHFVKLYARSFSKSVKGVTPAAMQRLLSYDWPGNVRELENLIQRAVILCDGDYIDEDALQIPTRSRQMGLAGKSLDEIEKEAILETLKMTGGNISQAARILGITRKTLRMKMDKYGISRGE